MPVALDFLALVGMTCGGRLPRGVSGRSASVADPAGPMRSLILGKRSNGFKRSSGSLLLIVSVIGHGPTICIS